MATYKVPQDIEAEDKLLGWLTLRQFIYAFMVVGMVFAAFRLALIHPVWAIPFLPPILLFSVLASPFGGDQPSEVWLLAKVRYFLKPRRRIWDQNGMKDLVTITAPKKIERVLTNSLSQTEVRSRLQALADTIDSRGWAVKNVGTNLYSQPAYAFNQADPERLIDASSIAREAPAYDAQPSDDMLDEQTSATAQHFTQMIAASEQTRRQQAVSQMHAPAAPASQADATAQQAQPPNDYWFMNTPAPPADPGYAVFDGSQSVVPGSPSQALPQQPAQATPEEEALLDKIRSDKSNPDASYNSHMRRIDPLSATQQSNTNNPAPQATDNGRQNTGDRIQATNDSPAPTAATDPAILGLANNDDLNIETLARQAEKSKKQPPASDEVIVPLR